MKIRKELNPARFVADRLKLARTDASEVRELALWSWKHTKGRLQEPICDDDDSIALCHSFGLRFTDRAIDLFRREASWKVWSTVRNMILNIRGSFVWPEQDRRAYVTMLKRARGNLIDELWLCNFRSEFLREQIERMSEANQRRCIRLATYIDDECNLNLVTPLTATVSQAKRLFVDQYGRTILFRTLESQLDLARAAKEALENERRWACRHTRALSDNPQPGELLEMIEMSRPDYRFATRRELILRGWSHKQIRILEPDRKDTYRRSLYSLNKVQNFERERGHVLPPTPNPDQCLHLVAWRMQLN